jgi:hypothetical protein
VVGKLVSCWFFEIKLENGLSHDRNRWEKIGKDAKRLGKMTAVLKNTVSCDVANAHVLFNRFSSPRWVTVYVRVVLESCFAVMCKVFSSFHRLLYTLLLSFPSMFQRPAVRLFVHNS